MVVFLRSAAGQDEFAEVVFAARARQQVHQQPGHGRYDVRTARCRVEPCEHLPQVPGVEALPACAARRPQPVVAVGLQAPQELLADLPARCHRPVRVVALRPAARVLGRRIHQRPGRANIVGGQHLAAIDHREVRDAAQVDGRAGAGAAGSVGAASSAGTSSEQHLVEQGHQGSALAACGDIAAPQIGDHRHAEALGNDTRVAKLKGAEGAAGAVDPVIERLAVQDREVGPAAREVVAGSHEGGSIGVSELGVQLAELAGARQAWRHRRDDPLAQPGGERRAREPAVPAAQLVARELQVGAGDVDTVHGRARHAAQHAHRPVR